MTATFTPEQTTALADRAPRTGRRRVLSAVALSIVASMFGLFGLSMSTAHAAYGGSAECANEYFGGNIIVRPGRTTAGATAVENLYVYNWGTGQWQSTGVWASERSASDGTFLDTVQINQFPYHQQYFAIWEVVYSGGRAISSGWYNSYDHGPWSFNYSGPRYTTSCWIP